jgi:hypothetical protein
MGSAKSIEQKLSKRTRTMLLFCRRENWLHPSSSLLANIGTICDWAQRRKKTERERAIGEMVISLAVQAGGGGG